MYPVYFMNFLKTLLTWTPPTGESQRRPKYWSIKFLEKKIHQCSLRPWGNQSRRETFKFNNNTREFMINWDLLYTVLFRFSGSGDITSLTRRIRKVSDRMITNLENFSRIVVILRTHTIQEEIPILTCSCPVVLNTHIYIYRITQVEIRNVRESCDYTLLT